MIVNNFAIESQFVNEFMTYTFTHPLLVDNQSVHLFIWGHEIWLQDGKVDCNSGILDVIATDDRGEGWLIEGKLNSNAEWNANIWRHQIGLYAKSLQTKSEQQIVLGARRYISKLSKGTVFPSFLSEEITSLSHAFGVWAQSIHRDYEDGLQLYEQTMSKLSNGEVIQCVLSNEPGHEIWHNRPKNDGYAYAYITFKDNQLDLVLEKNQATYYSSHKPEHWSHETFDYYLKEKNTIKPTISNIPLLLADNVVPTYEKIISFLEDLGWNGKYKSNQKAFQVDLPTMYDVPIRIHIGWIDADGQQSIEYRTAYHFGLKFNIDFRHFKRHPDANVWGIGYALAKELAEKARYNKRGKEFEILDPYWTAARTKHLKWDGEMYRFINQQNRDYIGLQEEQKDLDEALKFLKRIVSCS